jgi:hypothetical protein
MAACFNCRGLVSPSATNCPHCGAAFIYGTWRTPLSGVSNSRFGWGLSSKTLNSWAFRLACLLVPIWLPLVLAAFLGGQPGGLGGLVLLVAPFVFIPGVYVVANAPGWSGLARLLASLTYVGVSGFAGFVALSRVTALMQQV